MSDTVSAIIQASLNDKNYSKSITNVSASASDSDIYDFATGLYALSQQNVQGVWRVDKRQVEHAEPAPTPTTRTLTIAEPENAYSSEYRACNYELQFTGDGVPYIKATSFSDSSLDVVFSVNIVHDTLAGYYLVGGGQLENGESCTVTVALPATASYSAAEATVTINGAD